MWASRSTSFQPAQGGPVRSVKPNGVDDVDGREYGGVVKRAEVI